MEAGWNIDSVMSRWGMEVEPIGRDEMPLNNLERRRRMNMKIETRFRKIRASNTPGMYQYPRLFPEIDS